MSNFERVINKGEELHPMVNKKFFTMPISIDMTIFFRSSFKMDDYHEFITKIKEDKEFKDYVIKYVKNHFHQDNREVVSSIDGITWFFVDYKKREEKSYTLFYVESLCNLNNSIFLDNYVDIFGNLIEFERY